MSSNPNTELPTEQIETMDLATAQRVEQEKMTRRAALRKLGFGAGMAAFALLGVDDFARMVGKRMERMAGDNKVAEQVAKEFQGMGLALATTPYTYYTCALEGCKNPDECTSNAFIQCAPCSSTPGHPCVKEAFNCNHPYSSGNVPCQDCCYNMQKQCVAANYGGCDTLYNDCIKNCPATG